MPVTADVSRCGKKAMVENVILTQKPRVLILSISTVVKYPKVFCYGWSSEEPDAMTVTFNRVVKRRSRIGDTVHIRGIPFKDHNSVGHPGRYSFDLVIYDRDLWDNYKVLYDAEKEKQLVSGKNQSPDSV